jgi:DNA repair protein RadC
MRVDSSSNEGHRQRLRDRFVKAGLNGFADYEVVELLSFRKKGLP